MKYAELWRVLREVLRVKEEEVTGYRKKLH